MLIPMYLLIGVWGGQNRLYAAIKFFLYTLAGSVLLLVAIIVLFFQGGRTFDIQLLSKVEYAALGAALAFLGVLYCLCRQSADVSVPDLVARCACRGPHGRGVVLASVLLKMGAYGFLRFTLPLLPDATATFTPMMIALSIVAILYGAYMALAQSDLKKLIAYSSVSHMGFVTLGIFALNEQGIEGALVQMVNHGITTGALFLCVGAIYERTHSRLIMDNTGLAGPMPRYATFLVIFALSSLGLPGTNSFVGEFLVLVGTFFWNRLAAVLASLGIILAAAYMLWMVQRVAFGVPAKHQIAHLTDLNGREMAMLIPLFVLVFWIGVYPSPLLAPMHSTVNRLVQRLDHEKSGRLAAEKSREEDSRLTSGSLLHAVGSTGAP